jgi:hypothetical protein
MPYLTKINEDPQQALRFYDGLYRSSREEASRGWVEGLRIVAADLDRRLRRAAGDDTQRLQGVTCFIEELLSAVETSGQTAEKYYHQLKGEKS